MRILCTVPTRHCTPTVQVHDTRTPDACSHGEACTRLPIFHTYLLTACLLMHSTRALEIQPSRAETESERMARREERERQERERENRLYRYSKIKHERARHASTKNHFSVSGNRLLLPLSPENFE